MNIKSVRHFILLAAIVAAAAHLFSTANATAGFFGKFLDQTGSCRRCPACDHVCKLDAERVEEERTCFDVETKVICIPRVVFPWQKKNCGSCGTCDGNGCDKCINNGARTRRICVLKPSSYKCPQCKYTWSAEKKEGCGGCAAGTCDGVACDAPVPNYAAPLPPGTQLPTPVDYGQPTAVPAPVVDSLPAPVAQ